MLFNKNTLYASILVTNIINLFIVENILCMKIAHPHTILPEINIGRSTKPYKKTSSPKVDYFMALDQALRLDLELMSFIAIPEDKLFQGPLQYALTLFDNNYLLNVEKLNAVYELIDEILRIKNSIPVKKFYTSYKGLIQPKITELMSTPDKTLISLMFMIEDNLISYKDIHENLIFAAKDYLIEQTTNWHTQQFYGKKFATRLLFFSGEGYKQALKNIERTTPWNKKNASRIFHVSETVNFAIVLIELFNDIRVQNRICIASPKIMLLKEMQG